MDAQQFLKILNEEPKIRELLKGDTGPMGPVGPVGPMGPIGMTGAQGMSGPVGHQGPKGPKGPPDAVEILKGVQPSERYLRSRTVYEAEFGPITMVGAVHLSVFVATEGAAIEDHRLCLMVRNGSTHEPYPKHGIIDMRYGFALESSRDLFHDWLARYQRLFGDADLTKSLFASLPEHGPHSLTFVDPPEMSFDMVKSTEFLVWISQNCTSPFYHTNPIYPWNSGKLAFANPDEAFAFNLRFRGT